MPQQCLTINTSILIFVQQMIVVPWQCPPMVLLGVNSQHFQTRYSLIAMKAFIWEALISGFVAKMELGVGLRHFAKVIWSFILTLSCATCRFYILLSLQVSWSLLYLTLSAKDWKSVIFSFKIEIGLGGKCIWLPINAIEMIFAIITK